MTKRNDPHRPSVISPSDYEACEWPNAFHDYGRVANTCDHCGHGIRYAAGFIHIPTGERVWFGEECAELIDSPSRLSYEFKRMRKAAALKRKQEMMDKEWVERREQMERELPKVVEYFDEVINWEVEKFTFLIDMKFAYDKWGSLTDRQAAAVVKIMTKRLEMAAAQLDKVDPETAAPEGRVQVTGEIVKTKWQDSYYGTTHKMLVLLDDGNKVWGTVPNSLEDAVSHFVGHETTDLKGQRVSFTATFEQSKDDSHFSYFKRPTKASIVSTQEVTS